MAKATVTLTCKTCGKTFERTTTRNNRREADQWVEWAKDNIDTCPSCRYKEQVEAEKAAGLIAKLRLGDPYNDSETIWFVLYGDTYPIKEQLKSIGAKWTDEYPSEDNSMAASLFYGLSMYSIPKRWAICCQFAKEAVDQTQSQLESIGFHCEYPNANTVRLWRSAHQESLRLKKKQEDEKAQQEAAEEKARTDALAELGPKPPWPEDIRAIWPDGATWNGKIYGRSGHYSIYLGGKKFDLTDTQAAAMEKTHAARMEWVAKTKEILGK